MAAVCADLGIDLERRAQLGSGSGPVRGGGQRWLLVPPLAGGGVQFIFVASNMHRRYRSFRRPQQTQPVSDYQQAGAHIGEDGHPHAGIAKHSQHQEHDLDAQRQRDVLPENAVGFA